MLKLVIAYWTNLLLPLLILKNYSLTLLLFKKYWVIIRSIELVLFSPRFGDFFLNNLMRLFCLVSLNTFKNWTYCAHIHIQKACMKRNTNKFMRLESTHYIIKWISIKSVSYCFRTLNRLNSCICKDNIVKLPQKIKQFLCTKFYFSFIFVILTS